MEDSKNINRLLRRIQKRDKRIAGLERRIQLLERKLVDRTLDLGNLSRNIKKEVQDALCNVRMIPVHASLRDKIITPNDLKV